ncbi:MAG: sigma-54-dependent Fis family transcriptional regulator [Myxococcales bacterium]|nr:sigma-54-dependent Fis family transcriptional regulator [Myxococcales bacterium]MCB9582344.1 sigma-54-dependent Fis family transcriptional regulator [Polyangiaceae bacterium]
MTASILPPPEPGSRAALVVDDEPAACDLLRDGLSAEGFAVTTAGSASEAWELLGTQRFGVVVTDLNLTGASGTELCEQVVATYPDVPVIVVTAFGSMETAVAALRAGAYDFITKPFELEAVAMSLHRALDHFALRQEVRRLRTQVDRSKRFGALLGSSPRMLEVYDLLERISDSDTTVLITGESGTGKEVVARELHRRSRRRDGPFIAINCAAMPEALLESELFGHERGAFTDARQAREGLMPRANGGTLFLDEIGELPLGLQPKLLRALQERVVRPVGGSEERPFDARIVAATNRDLETAIEEKTFREDLFYRINVINVPLPPLRARGGDVLLLAQHFLAHFASVASKNVHGLSPAAAKRLMAYPFPGNVRELQNCIERAVALTRDEEIQVEDLPQRILEHESRNVLVASDDPSDLVPLEEVERRYILRVLSAVEGNKSLAAKILGVGRKTLYRRLDAWGES